MDVCGIEHIRVRQAAQKLTPGLEYIFYNAHNNFTLQYPLLLASLRAKDDLETVNRKVRLVAGYLDIFLIRRAVNFRTLDYSSIVYTMFNLMKEIRELDVLSLTELLKAKVAIMEETFDGIARFYLNLWSKRYIHHILARMTQHIEKESGVESNKAARVFVGFHESASQYFERLSFHLAGLERAGLIEVWSERKLLPGSNPLEEIKRAITTAHIAILFLNADFFVFPRIAEYELPLLLATAEKEDLIILPVIVGSCELEYTSLSHIPTINDPQKPVRAMSLNERENTWVQCATIIRNILTPGSTWSYSLLRKKPNKQISKSRASKVSGGPRKQWRNLETVTYPVLSDSNRSREKFALDLAYTLDQVFKARGYTTFTGLVRLNERDTPDQKVPVYQLICHQPEFCEAFRQKGIRFLSRVISSNGSTLSSEELEDEKEEMRQEIIRESTDFAERWSVNATIPFLSVWAAIRFIYDPATRHISLYPVELVSPNPSDYPDPEHITTTSELLIYLASLSMLPVDDFNWYKANYPLLKITAAILEDGAFSFKRIKTNVKDYEEWDYDYPQLDAETKRYQG